MPRLRAAGAGCTHVPGLGAAQRQSVVPRHPRARVSPSGPHGTRGRRPRRARMALPCSAAEESLQTRRRGRTCPLRQRRPASRRAARRCAARGSPQAAAQPTPSLIPTGPQMRSSAGGRPSAARSAASSWGGGGQLARWAPRHALAARRPAGIQWGRGGEGEGDTSYLRSPCLRAPALRRVYDGACDAPCWPFCSSLAAVLSTRRASPSARSVRAMTVGKRSRRGARAAGGAGGALGAATRGDEIDRAYARRLQSRCVRAAPPAGARAPRAGHAPRCSSPGAP